MEEKRKAVNTEHKLTVLLLCYEMKDTLERAFNSIMAQDYDAFCVYIADDGSRDGTADLARALADKHRDRVTHFGERREPSFGGDHANFGHLMKYVKTPYFAILDGDDYLTDETKFSQQMRFLESHQDFTICGHNYLEETESGDMLKACEDGGLYASEADSFEDIIKGGVLPYMQTSSLVYKNLSRESPDFYERFLTSGHYSGDFIRTLLHAEYGSAKYIDEVMSVYSYNASGDWTRRGDLKIAEFYCHYFAFHIKHSFRAENRAVGKKVLKNYLKHYYDLLVANADKNWRRKALIVKIKLLKVNIGLFWSCDVR